MPEPVVVRQVTGRELWERETERNVRRVVARNAIVNAIEEYARVTDVTGWCIDDPDDVKDLARFIRDRQEGARGGA